MKHASRFVLALWLAALPGCFVARNTVNEPLLPDELAQLVPNETTATEAAALLGAPNEVVQLGHRSAWRYDYTVRKDSGLFLLVVAFSNRDTHQDRAWLFFDEEGTLTHVGATLESGRTEYAMPWYELDH